MTDETIFTSDNKSVPPTDQNGENKNQGNVTPDFNAVFKDQLTSIVNDEGQPKYTDVMTALEALKHSQEHIRTLENENKGLKSSVTQQSTIEEALNRLATKTDQSAHQTPGSKEIDVEQLRRIAREENLAMSAEQQAAANMKQVSETLIQKFGEKDKAKKAFSVKAEELGVTPDFLQSLASTSPKAVLEYFKTATSPSIKHTQSTVSTQVPLGTRPDQQNIGKVGFGATSAQKVTAWNELKQSILSENN